MRIAFFTTEYPTERVFIGGLSTYLKRMVVALSAMGHEPEIFTLSHCDGLIMDDGVPVHRVCRHALLSESVGFVPLVNKFCGALGVLERSYRMALAARRRHSRKPFDVIQAANCRSCGLVSALWGFAPVVTWAAAYEPLLRLSDPDRKPHSLGQKIIERLEVAQMRYSKGVYAPSTWLATQLQQSAGIDCRMVEPPFDVESFVANVGSRRSVVLAKPYALFFGKIGILKGCERLLKILPGILKRNRDIRFVFVGPIQRDSRGRRFDHAFKEDLADFDSRVVLLDGMPHDELMPIVRDARLVVLPSKVENLPNACMEAMALSKVVIATRDVSFEQIIEDKINGFLVSQEDDNELSAMIETVWRMPEAERRAIGEKAQKTLERLHPKNTVANLLRLYADYI